MTRASQLIVVALGGNAITRPDGPPGIPEQFRQTARTAGRLADLIERGFNILITHGNGPQVGNILRRVEIAADEVYPLPLDICVADSQGGMGYMIAQCLTNELLRRRMAHTVTAVVTTVVVDAADPAFDQPSKPIGGYFPADQARHHHENDGWTVKEVLKGKFRRVVPSPLPRRILEEQPIKQLLDAGQLIIACGGGGVPVIQQPDGTYEGVAAVVDKDRASAILATQVSAQGLFILTAVEKVSLYFDRPQRRDLDHMTVAEAKQFLSDGHFPPGSMGPKIEAAVRFLESSVHADAFVLITSPENLLQGLLGRAGTRLTKT